MIRINTNIIMAIRLVMRFLMRLMGV